MLKDMSAAVGSAYGNMLAANEFNKELIRFSGLKWELSNNLLNEFVTPIERSDIYNLADCLNEELYCISKLNNFINLVNLNELDFIMSVSAVFKRQNEVFSMFSDIKNPQKTIKLINETRATLNGVSSSIILSIKNCLKTTDQPLLKYAIFCGFFDIYKAIDVTFSTIQKVIINNN